METELFVETGMRERSIAETEAAIECAEAGADEEWIDTAYAAVVMVAATFPLFTADDVWIYGKLPSTRNNSALGPVMRMVAKDGKIAATDMFKRSIRNGTHGKPLPVWKSLKPQLTGVNISRQTNGEGN